MKTKCSDWNPSSKDDRHFRWLLSGSELLLIEQNCAALVGQLRSLGCQHYRVHAHEGIDKAYFCSLFDNQNLFGQSVLVEIRLSEGKEGRITNDLLLSIIPKTSNRCYLIIVAPSQTKLTATNWVKSFEQGGLHVEHPKLNERQRAVWLDRRLAQNSIDLDRDAKQLLLTVTENNLLALEQEIVQLEGEGVDGMDVDKLKKRLEDQAKFGLFVLAEKTFQGHSRQALRVCRNLRSEGVDLVPLVWSMSKEFALILQVSDVQKMGQDMRLFFDRFRIWPLRQKILLGAAKLGTVRRLNLLRDLQKIDQQSKGQLTGDGWLSLERFIVTVGLLIKP